MKIYSLSIIFIFISISNINAQDTLVKSNGDTLIINVLFSSFHNIKYSLADNKKAKIISKTKIIKIIYRDGKQEYCVPEARIFQVMNTDSWNKVILTNKVDRIRESISLGEVYGECNFFQRMKKGAQMRYAEDDIKKNAYKKGASIVLLRGHTAGRHFRLRGIAFR